MKIQLKMTGHLYHEIVLDLTRPHPFATERVGFVFGRIGTLVDGGKLILLTRYYVIPDDHYVDDPGVGARIGSEAMAWTMPAVYEGRPTHEGIFHIHMHAYPGPPGMSPTDKKEIPPMIPGFQSMGRDAAHGIIVLSLDHASAWVWLPKSNEAAAVEQITVIGVPIGVFEHGSGR